MTSIDAEITICYTRDLARTAQFERDPVHNPEYGVYHCFLRDPNGYLLEIQCFDDPDWNR